MKNKTYRGFTLIELLIGVVIIGILSAVALPQYQKTVTKNTLVSAIPNMRYFKDQLELYFLEKGTYPQDAGLSTDWLSIPNCIHTGSGRFNCKSYGFDYEGFPSFPNPLVRLCLPNCNENAIRVQLRWYLDHTTTPSRKLCISSITGLCQSLQNVWK